MDGPMTPTRVARWGIEALRPKNLCHSAATAAAYYQVASDAAVNSFTRSALFRRPSGQAVLDWIRTDGSGIAMTLTRNSPRSVRRT